MDQRPPIRPQRRDPSAPTMRQIIRVTSDLTGLNVTEIMARRRNLLSINARFALIAIARSYGHSLTTIGRALDRDHTSILNSVQALATLRQNKHWRAEWIDKLVARGIEALETSKRPAQIVTSEDVKRHAPKHEPVGPDWRDEYGYRMIRRTRNGYIDSKGQIICRP